MEKLTLVVAFLLLVSFFQPLTAESGCPEVKKDIWPELVGVPAKLAKEIIQKESSRLNIGNILIGTPVTLDVRCDRVRLFVNVLDFLVETPRIG
ncbi:unnamed protein product [Withania somnifera]